MTTVGFRRGAAAILAASVSALAMAVSAPAAHADGALKPMYGKLSPFYGRISPFYGKISPFGANLEPFYGKISPFFSTDAVTDVNGYWGSQGAFAGDTKAWWGTLDPVTRQAPGAPAYLSIRPFWDQAGGRWATLSDAWAALDPATASASAYAPVASQLKGLIASSQSFWGASVQAQSGRSFQDAVASPLLAKWNIDLNNPESLRQLSPGQRAAFFLDWYDQLMNYAGTDHVDYWMKVVNWSPAVTQVQGAGLHTTIGLLDYTVVGDATLQKNIVKYDGVSTFTNGHGAAVGSLIVGAHDGKDVMGIAPKARVIAYNPFDNTGTAGWPDVTQGIMMLAANGASVVNMSLGEPGVTLSQGWNDVFSRPLVSLATHNMIFVAAAGNEGVTQTSNVEWNFKTNPDLIVVGSVGADGTISNFSNRPGDACLTTNGACAPGDELKNHFIVAPGEMILMSDDHGGTTRMSGTSFAAPLVSGAIALLHDRWPWLVFYPDETAQIILKSAKDLGAPGPDPVYGVGLLDIQASQSPLSFNNLQWLKLQKDGSVTSASVQSVISTYNNKSQTAFDATDAFYYAFETIGATRRDFAIPMTSKLVGQTFKALSGYQAYYQSYLLGQMDSWARSRGLVDSTGDGGAYDLASPWGGRMTLTMAPRSHVLGLNRQDAPYQVSVRLTGERASFATGFGDGAVALSGQTGFGLASDYQAVHGGADPLLGLASGGLYAGWRYAPSDRLQLSAGLTQRSEQRVSADLPRYDQAGKPFVYRASAERIGMSYRLAPGLELTGAFTWLAEGDAVLGVQSLDPQDFTGGARTSGVTLGARLVLSPRLALAAAATSARTRPGPRADGLQIGQQGLDASAYQLSLTGEGVLARNDAFRLTLAQPMHVSRGSLEAAQVEVVDRQTGRLGLVTHSFDVTQRPTYSAEALYAVPAFKDRGDVALFGLVETAPEPGPVRPKDVLVGARVRLGW